MTDLHAEARELGRQMRRHTLRSWLDSDPDLRFGFIAMNPELGKLNAHVEKLERLAVGFRTSALAAPEPDHCP